MSVWPNELFDFAFIHNFDDRLADLAELAEDEIWEYQNTPNARSTRISAGIKFLISNPGF